MSNPFLHQKNKVMAAEEVRCLAIPLHEAIGRIWVVERLVEMIRFQHWIVGCSMFDYLSLAFSYDYFLKASSVEADPCQQNQVPRVSWHLCPCATDSSAAAATSWLAEAFVAASYPRFVDEGLRWNVLSIVTLITSVFLFAEKNLWVGTKIVVVMTDAW